MAQHASSWWQSATIYQIYPRSFQDSTADGVGDLPGIERRLDYLVQLGITTIWISPIYPSPGADFGYDVADYTAIDPLFGTMADFDSLLKATHDHGLRLILDFVPNHTSDQHPWFLASKSSRTDPKRDWYIWRDAKENGPPNNWPSNFGGSAWTLDNLTGQYYLHSFLPQQPDLNWWNPEVRRAVFECLAFWLNKGIDGFRMDVLWLLIKDPLFRDNPPNPAYTGGNTLWSVLPKYTANQPETHTIVHQFRTLLDHYQQRPVLIGEIYLDIPELVTYYGTPQRPEAHLPFNFHLIQTPWQAPPIAQLLRDYEAALPEGAWPNYVLGNHDQTRLATRIGAAQARVAAVLLLTLRGTPTLYNGDELGLPDAVITPDQVRDPAELRQPGIGQGRDPERSPLPWTNAANAGFTSPEATTWLPLVQNWPAYSVETETLTPGSSLKLYQTLLALRNTTPALTTGTIENITEANGVLSFTRNGTHSIHLNFTGAYRDIDAPGILLLTSYLDQGETEITGAYTLRPNEAILLKK